MTHVSLCITMHVLVRIRTLSVDESILNDTWSVWSTPALFAMLHHTSCIVTMVLLQGYFKSIFVSLSDKKGVKSAWDHRIDGRKGEWSAGLKEKNRRWRTSRVGRRSKKSSTEQNIEHRTQKAEQIPHASYFMHLRAMRRRRCRIRIPAGRLSIIAKSSEWWRQLIWYQAICHLLILYYSNRLRRDTYPAISWGPETKTAPIS